MTRKQSCYFQFTELRAGKDKSVLLTGTNFVYEEILTRFAGNRRGIAGNAFLIEKLAQQTSNHAAGGIDRMGLTAQPLDDARYIDSASPRGRAAKLCDRQDLVYGSRQVDGRVWGNRYNIDHQLAPAVATFRLKNASSPTKLASGLTMIWTGISRR